MISHIRFAAVLSGTLLMAGWNTMPVAAQQPDTVQQTTPDATPAQTQPGVEVLGRGPVHEAFAQPSATDPKPSPVAPKAPPAPINEVPPGDRPDGPNVEWMP